MKLRICIHALLLAAIVASPLTPQTKPTQPNKAQNTLSEWGLRGRLAANPHDRESHKKLCDLLNNRGDIRELVEERRSWSADNPDDWFELAQLMAEAEVRLYGPEYAIAAAKRFLSNRNSNLRPEDIAGASGNLARLLVRLGRPSEAIPYLEATTKAICLILEGSGQNWAMLSVKGPTKTGAFLFAMRINPQSGSAIRGVTPPEVEILRVSKFNERPPSPVYNVVLLLVVHCPRASPEKAR